MLSRGCIVEGCRYRFYRKIQLAVMNNIFVQLKCDKEDSCF